MTATPLVVVMGVAGCGKSTVGARLAQHLGVPFCEGDVLHPAANIEKMRAGQPLDDEDRRPWLVRVNRWLREQDAGGVVSCSALRRRYRDRLREGLDGALRVVLLDPPRRELERRLAVRTSHFMPPSLLDSQLAGLEPPDAGEQALRLAGPGSPEQLVEEVVGWLRRHGS